MKSLLFLALILATPLTSPAQSISASNPQSTPRPVQQPRLGLFDGSLYSAEPLIDSTLMLPKEKFDAILAADKAHESDPELKAAKAAEAAATGDAKIAANEAKKKVEAANKAALNAVLAANLSEEDRAFIESLNKAAKSEKKRAAADSGVNGITKADPQFADLKSKAVELEKMYLQTLIASTLPEARKAALEQARAAVNPPR